MPNLTNSPLAEYQALVAAGKLRADREQIKTLRQLNILHRHLSGHTYLHMLLSKIIKTDARVPSIYIWGGVGSGKTMLMDLFAQALPDDIVWRIHFHNFIQWVHDSKNEIAEKRDPLERVAARITEKVRVLCLDEFIVTDITDAMILARLLATLFERGLVLVTTSNTPPQDLYKDGLQRARFLPAIEIIKSNMRVVRLDGGYDYRADYLQLARLYHCPHDRDAKNSLQKSFAQLEGAAVGLHNSRAQENILYLNARAVAAVAVGRETVWFEFASLCETNRSAADYLQLARRYRTLILSDIPKLPASKDDSARRLIELVDTLYDSGVNLLVSAAAPPHELYSGERLAADFKRTASRLNEMASQQYIHTNK